LQGVVAAVLLLTGGLAALQAATIATALPFTIVMLVLVWGLWRGMQADLVQQRSRMAHGPAPAHPAAELPWQRRLALALRVPTEREVADFISSTVEPALEVVAAELRKRDRPAEVSRNAETGAVMLTSPAEGVRDFVYGVQRSDHKLPAFFAFEAAKPEFRHEARTFFSDGSRGYDVMGLTRDQIIADVLAQFERYLVLVQMPEAALVARAPGHA
jgi:choline/glycine/proline betaine transport protein